MSAPSYIIVGFRLCNFGRELYTQLDGAYGPFTTHDETQAALRHLWTLEHVQRQMHGDARPQTHLYVSELHTLVVPVKEADAQQAKEEGNAAGNEKEDDDNDEDEEEGDDDEDDNDDDDAPWITVV